MLPFTHKYACYDQLESECHASECKDPGPSGLLDKNKTRHAVIEKAIRAAGTSHLVRVGLDALVACALLHSRKVGVLRKVHYDFIRDILRHNESIHSIDKITNIHTSLSRVYSKKIFMFP